MFVPRLLSPIRYFIIINVIMISCGGNPVPLFAAPDSTVILKAPFDGYVIKSAAVGEQFELGISESRKRWKKVFDDNKVILSQSFKDFEPFFNPPSNVQPAVATPVAKMGSPLLAMQLQEESNRVLHAIEVKQRIEKIIERERELNRLQEDFQRLTFEYESKLLSGRLHFSLLKSQGLDGNDKEYIWKRFTDMNATKKDIAVKTNDRVINLDLANRLADSQRAIDAAKSAVQVIETTQSLGQITCPFACEVVEVYVAEGQWVIKGDALLKVRRPQ